MRSRLDEFACMLEGVVSEPVGHGVQAHVRRSSLNRSPINSTATNSIYAWFRRKARHNLGIYAFGFD
jgi:hypothetical protein